MTKTLPPPRHFDESVAEWRNLTPKCSKPMVAGDLSTLRFIRVQSLCTPYRRVSPLEMTMSAGSIQSFPEGQIDQNDALPRHFDRSKVEWRNFTPKCGKPIVAGDLSTLRFIRAPSPCHPYRQVPPRDDAWLETCHQNKS